MTASPAFISVADLVAGVTSNTDGDKLLRALRTALAAHEGPVTLSLHGLPLFSSSFLNSSLGALHEEAGAAALRRIRLADYKPAQLAQLKQYLAALPQLA